MWKYKRRKKVLTSFVTARELAQPPRCCSITRARLPRSFLQPFSPVTNDFVKKAWWVPKGSVPEVYTAALDRSPGENAQQLSKGPIAWAMLNREVLTPVPDMQQERTVMSRKLMSPKLWRNAQMPEGQLPVYREGMTTVMLETMRDRIMERLTEHAKFSEEGGKYLVPLPAELPKGTFAEDAPEEQGAVTIRGCILYTDPELPTWGMMREGTQWCPGKARRKGDAGQDRAPGPYATMSIGQTRYNAKVPVHNLLYLLGKERVDELRKNSVLFRENQTLMLARTLTHKTQHHLWAMQGFMTKTMRETKEDKLEGGA